MTAATARPLDRAAASRPAVGRPAGGVPRQSTAPVGRPGSVAAARRGRAVFALWLAAVLAVGLAALLLLHTWAAQDGFHLAALQQQQASLTTTQQDLAASDQRLESPARLREAAVALGMRPTGTPRFIRLGGGRVAARAQAVAPPPVVMAAPAPSAAPHGARPGPGHRSGAPSDHHPDRSRPGTAGAQRGGRATPPVPAAHHR